MENQLNGCLKRCLTERCRNKRKESMYICAYHHQEKLQYMFDSFLIKIQTYSRNYSDINSEEYNPIELRKEIIESFGMNFSDYYDE